MSMSLRWRIRLSRAVLVVGLVVVLYLLGPDGRSFFRNLSLSIVPLLVLFVLGRMLAVRQAVKRYARLAEALNRESADLHLVRRELYDLMDFFGEDARRREL